MLTHPSAQAQQDTVYALARTTNYLYAARKSGLYRSTDGAAWVSALDSLDVPDGVIVTALAVQGETIFAGANGAILRSDDDGAHWHVALLPAPAPVIAAFALSPRHAHDGVIAAATAEDGVFVSMDRGETWVPWNFGLIDLNAYCIAISPNFATDRTILVGTESGIFRSKNAGRSWRDLPFPMEIAPVVSLALSATYPTDGVIYAGTAEHGLYLSDDFGTNWRPLSSAPTGTPINSITLTDRGLWLLLDDRLVVSRDGGAAWQTVYQCEDGKLAMSVLLSEASADTAVSFIGTADGDIVTLP